MQDTRASRPAPRLVAAAAFALFAANAAHAVDWTGYMRGGPAATDVSGKSRQCYGIGELKYRLGNECDFYGEFQLAQAMKADGVDFNAVLMTNYYSPQTESNSNYGVEQAYVEMKGVDIAPQALFWMGKRRDRDDVHIVDTFFTNMSGVGAGVENIDVGFGKFGFSGYKTDSAAQYVDGQLSTTAGTTTASAACTRSCTTSPSTRTASCAWWPPYSKGDSQGGRQGPERLRLQRRARAGQVLRRRQPHLGAVRARLDRHQPGLQRQRLARLGLQDLAHRGKPVVADRLVRRPGHRACTSTTRRPTTTQASSNY